ncbi:adenylyl-sulfate kinase [Candidatus Thorarchaeota archaeon]|nr:MAG: adenylyl-sulfate kinase [Candidatus Thorarchaeota archaeon]
MEKGFCIWLTGLSGSGKTTIAQKLAEILKPTRYIELMDGDEIRKGLSRDLGFSKEDRNEHNKRVIFCSKLLSRNGVIVVVALISPYRETRAYAKETIPNTIEVFVKAPLEVCMTRDPKGLYQKALAGEIKNFTGIDDPYEEPLEPDLIVETDKETVEESVTKIIKKAQELGHLPKEIPIII